jgi:hypothetical protein
MKEAPHEPYLGIGPWERATDIDWSPEPPLGHGLLPAEWVH